MRFQNQVSAGGSATQGGLERRRSRKQRSLEVHLLRMEQLEPRAMLSTVSWATNASGLWSDPSNWLDDLGDNRVPAAGDDVTISRPSASVVVTLPSGAFSVQSLNVAGNERLAMSGGSLTIGQASVISSIDLSGGVLVANGEVSLTGGSTLSGSGTFVGSVLNAGTLAIPSGDPNINSGTLTNNGTITHGNARLDFEGGGKLVNAAGAVYDLTYTGSGAYFAAFGGPGIDNAGTFRRSNINSATMGGATFNNLPGGVLDVTAGTLALDGPGTWQGATITVAAGATLDIGGGAHQVSGTLHGTGAGGVNFQSGTLSAATTAILDFVPGMFQFGGSAVINGGGVVTNVNHVTVANGDPNLNTVTLLNNGTITHGNARLDFEGGGKLINSAGAVYDLNYTGSGAYFGALGGAGIDNAGTFRRSNINAATMGNTTFNNLPGGVLDVTAGTLALDGPGAWQGATITVAAGATLDISGSHQVSGTLHGTGAGTVILQSGTLSAATTATLDFVPGMFQFGGSATIAGGGVVTNINHVTIANGDPNLNTVTLFNNGTITHGNARLDFEGGGKLINAAGAVYDLTYTGSGAYFAAFGGPGIDNAGTFRRSNVNAATMGSVTFNNLPGGALDVIAGTLALDGPGAWQGATITIAAGATLDIGGGTHQVSGTLHGTGAGVVNFQSGTLVAATTAALDFVPGMFQFGGSASITGGGGVTNINHFVVANGDPNLNTVTFVNSGSITHANARLDFEGGGKLINSPGAVYDLVSTSSGAYFASFGGPGIDNAGTFRRSNINGASMGNLTFNNLPGGVLDVTAGTLSLDGPGTWQGATMMVADGATLDIGGNTHQITGTLRGSGAGVVSFQSGALSAAGFATLDFAPGQFQFGGSATMTGGGVITNANAIGIANGDPNLNTVTLVNNGAIFHGNARLDFEGGGKLTNAVGAVYDLNYEGSGDYFGSFGGPGIENAGTFQRSVINTAGTGSIPFNNLGKVVALAGGISFNAGLAQISGSAITGGIWEVFPDANLFLSASFFNSNAGTLIFHGNGTITGIDGALSTNVGTIELLDGAGFGTVSDFTNSGSLVIGPGSVFATGGEFTQTSTGRVEFQLGGTPASGDFGRLISTEPASLAGIAAFTLADGYGPASGQVYALASFPSHTGSFDSFEGEFAQRTRIFDPVLSSTALTLNAIASAADLDLSNVTLTGGHMSGENITVHYTVVNNRPTETYVGQWVDSVYLSIDDKYDPSDKLVGRVTHNGVLGGNASYSDSLTAPLPGSRPGQYRVIVVADSQGRSPDSDRTNNSAAGGPIALDVTALTSGVPLSGTISDGQDLWFRVDLPAGQTPSFHATFALAGEAELYMRQGDTPDLTTFDEFAYSPTLARADITEFTGRAGTFYVLLHGRGPAGNGQPFTLTASGLPFGAGSLSVAQGANVGQVTTIVHGSLFTPGTHFSLVSGSGATIPAATQTYIDPATEWVTFNLQGLVPGIYGVKAEDGSASATLAGAFVVNAGTAGHLTYNLEAPRYIRPPFRGAILTLNYANTGGTDILAPLITIWSDNATFFTTGTGDAVKHAIEILAISNEGPAGVLAPGARGQIQITFRPNTQGAHAMSKFKARISGPSDSVIDWNVLKPVLKPTVIDATAWDAIYSNFASQLGNTVSQYNAAMAENASYLSRFGNYTSDVGELLSFELQQADNFGEISARDQLGTFGRGRVAPFSIRAVTTAAGNVLIVKGSDVRAFGALTGGGFLGTGDDSGVLTKDSNGGYHLRDKTGVETVFLPNGKFNYEQDANGNRITATYNGAGQLASVAATNGDSAVFTYNAQGRIATITDAVGRATTYSYDGSGERLSNFTDPTGTTTFTYITTAGPALHAIASVTYPDGSQIFNSYDAKGRLSGQTRNGGATPITLTYDTAGGARLTDAQGNLTQYFRGDGGEVARIIDPLNHVTDFVLNTFGRAIGSIDPNGAATSTSLNSTGNPTSLLDPLGYETTFNVSGSVARLRSITEPGGATTQFSYDTNGNLTAVTDALGNTATFAYDAHGNRTRKINENGQTVIYTYNAADQVIRKDLPGGAYIEYAYDSHRNLLTATDSNGVTSFTYDIADRETHIAYPNGKSLTYVYDAQGRRASVADQDGFTIRYQYDSLGRLTRVSDTADAMLVTYAYNTVGQVTTETHGNGTTTHYTYDAAGRTATITHAEPNSAIAASFAYTYDAAGHVTQLVTLEGTTTYGYDLLGQLTSVHLPNGRTITYQYDAAGNRAVVSDSLIGDAMYTTNAGNQYTGIDDESLSYDAVGNLTSRTDSSGTTTYSYDVHGRLTGVTSPTDTITYIYDALGNQIATIKNGQRADYTVDPNAINGLTQIFGEYDNSGSLVAHYAQGLGLTSRINASGQAAYYHFDSAGNTAALTGAGGAVLDTYSYLPFGEQVSSTGSTDNPFTFNGQFGVRDDGDGLYSMRARTYDATLGRFLQEDLISFLGGDSNLYRFAANNPVTGNDPSSPW